MCFCRLQTNFLLAWPKYFLHSSGWLKMFLLIKERKLFDVRRSHLRAGIIFLAEWPLNNYRWASLVDCRRIKRFVKESVQFPAIYNPTRKNNNNNKAAAAASCSKKFRFSIGNNFFWPFSYFNFLFYWVRFL